MINGIKIVDTDSKLNSYTKVQALETSLVQSCSNFKDLLLEFEVILSELEGAKSKVLQQKEKCENQTCTGSEALRKVIDVKDNIIQSIANVLIELNDTKNFNVINDAFRIISGEQSPLTPPKSEEACVKLETVNKPNELNQSDEYGSMAEINSPSGRKSPIISSKKIRNPTGAAADNVKVQEKKKCPEKWLTPERKTVKLTFPTPSNCKSIGKFRQARLNFVKSKTTSVVDLTKYSESAGDVAFDSHLENIKMEAMESDDTILPSPTSGPVDFTSIYKSISKSSPRKLKKSFSVLKLKTGAVSQDKENSLIEKEKPITNRGDNILKESNGCESSPNKRPVQVSKEDNDGTTIFLNDNKNLPQEKKMEESLDILKHFPCRYSSSPMKQSPSPKNSKKVSRECGNESMSILQQMNRVEDGECHPSSPSKRPSLHKHIQPTASELEDNATTHTRMKPDSVEAVFKEPTARKKADKQALPGWSCDECKQFYEVLYKEDQEALRRSVCSCSRHRARRDPASSRPRTPPGFWRPRWHVPTDTDDFNRLNDAM